MKKLIITAILLGATGTFAQEGQLRDFKCKGDEFILTFDDQFFSNVIQFEDTTPANFEALLNDDEKNLGIQKIRIETNTAIGACVRGPQGDLIASCVMNQDMGWSRGVLKFSYVKENDVISVERDFVIHKLDLAVVHKTHGTGSWKRSVAELGLQADISINGKDLRYTLSQEVGLYGGSKNDCEFRYGQP